MAERGYETEVALYGHPTMLELVEAVRGYLGEEVFPVAEGRLQFNTRVAMRVLDTVARQLRLAEGHFAGHSARLAALGYSSDEAFVEAIRAGEYDERIGELAAALEHDVAAKLEVADPRYLAT